MTKGAILLVIAQGWDEEEEQEEAAAGGHHPGAAPDLAQGGTSLAQGPALGTGMSTGGAARSPDPGLPPGLVAMTTGGPEVAIQRTGGHALILALALTPPENTKKQSAC